MARLYADKNFPQPAVERLREVGHDVLTVQDAGKAQQKLPDAVVLADACAAGRAVVTHNRKDFRALHATTPDHEGIIVCSEDLDFVGLADRIHAAIVALPTLSGQFIRIVRPQRG
jgi:predicted nuclease of predicted toxin-antitoxin system